MASIYPPHGPQDTQRYDSVQKKDREYSMFALEFCSKILEQRPCHVEALELAANHFTALGYYTDGLLLDQRLAEIRPEDPGVLYNLGCSLALIGRHDDAILTLSRAVQFGYHDHRHMSTDKDLGSLRDDPRFRELLRLMQGRGDDA